MLQTEIGYGKHTALFINPSIEKILTVRSFFLTPAVVIFMYHKTFMVHSIFFIEKDSN